jgi:hypothetical protein
LFEPKISTVSLLIIETDEWIDGLLLNDFLKPVFRTVKLKSSDFIDSRFPNGKMENLQAQVEAQGAKIRAMKEAIKADPASQLCWRKDRRAKQLLQKNDSKQPIGCVLNDFVQPCFYLQIRQQLGQKITRHQEWV